jgi:hypothetical protein
MIIVDQTKNDSPTTFYNTYNLGKMTNMDQLIRISYYTLTTLSTVGYGDYFPLSDIEVVISLVYILAGAAFFAFIMGSFIEIISNHAVEKLDDSYDEIYWRQAFIKNLK